ncbi:MAG: hypothetical protein HY692_05700 [Cyanobacteria bacterium NC_groundwater_1444_Ag_S-0.65um_54_12]|nr:hypothetical protein [Cyanobacteria bacterium NC_groundwater_1444_Ag_S-0.65um_54_12]
MKNFSVVQEHFRKLRCAHCNEAFTPDGVKLLREEKDYWVVKVHCTACNQPAGVAIVGVEYESNESTGARAEYGDLPTLTPNCHTRARNVFSSRREEEKFAEFPPITEDDVLDAHRFINSLGGNWMDHLPKKGR